MLQDLYRRSDSSEMCVAQIVEECLIEISSAAATLQEHMMIPVLVKESRSKLNRDINIQAAMEGRVWPKAPIGSSIIQ